MRRQIIAVILTLLMSITICDGFWKRTAMGSNFAIREDKVYFTQDDGSLTAVELATGQVLQQKQGWYHGTLYGTPQGLLLCRYGDSIFLDDDLSIKWEAAACREPKFADGLLITESNGAAQCRDLASGTTLWSSNLPISAPLELTAEDFVRREGRHTPWGPGRGIRLREAGCNSRHDQFFISNGVVNILYQKDWIPHAELDAGTNYWMGELPYLTAHGGVVEVVEANESYVLIGSSYGYVECIDINTGTTRWIYMFHSYGPGWRTHGPQWARSMASDAYWYQWAEEQAGRYTGLHLHGKDAPPIPPVTIDPEVQRRIRWRPLLLVIPWTGALLPFLSIFLIIWPRWQREQLNSRKAAFLTLLLAVINMIILYVFGPLSGLSFWALWIGLIICMLAALAMARVLHRQGYWISALVCALLALLLPGPPLSIYIFNALLH